MSKLPDSSPAVREVVTPNGSRAKIIVEDFTGPPAPAPAPEDPHAFDATIHNAALPSVATLCNSAIGAGVLSLPFAFRKTGVRGSGEGPAVVRVVG